MLGWRRTVLRRMGVQVLGGLGIYLGLAVSTALLRTAIDGPTTQTTGRDPGVLLGPFDPSLGVDDSFVLAVSAMLVAFIAAVTIAVMLRSRATDEALLWDRVSSERWGDWAGKSTSLAASVLCALVLSRAGAVSMALLLALAAAPGVMLAAATEQRETDRAAVALGARLRARDERAMTWVQAQLGEQPRGRRPMTAGLTGTLALALLSANITFAFGVALDVWEGTIDFGALALGELATAYVVILVLVLLWTWLLTGVHSAMLRARAYGRSASWWRWVVWIVALSLPVFGVVVSLLVDSLAYAVTIFIPPALVHGTAVAFATRGKHRRGPGAAAWRVAADSIRSAAEGNRRAAEEHERRLGATRHTAGRHTNGQG